MGSRVLRSVAAMLLCLLLGACGRGGGSTNTAKRLPQVLDDIAAQLRITGDDAELIVSTVAREDDSSKLVAAEAIADQATTVRRLPSVNATVDDLLPVVDEPQPTVENVVRSATCSLAVDAAFQGTAPTPEDAYDAVWEEWGQEWADHLWKLGWVHRVASVIEDLEQGDLDVSKEVVEFLYCS